MLGESHDPVRLSLNIAAAALLLVVVALFVHDSWAIYQRVQEEKLRSERAEFRPVSALEFETFECEGRDMIARGWLVKNKTEKGQWAKIESLAIYRLDPRDLVTWRGVEDDELVNRTPGFQHLVLRLVGECGEGFELHTVHSHPEDPSVKLNQGWGPFGESVEAPQPRVLY